MLENPRRGRQARNFTTNVPKILDLKSSSEQIFSENCRWVPLRNDGNDVKGSETFRLMVLLTLVPEGFFLTFLFGKERASAKRRGERENPLVTLTSNLTFMQCHFPKKNFKKNLWDQGRFLLQF